jgi:hypothetical protein
LLLAVLGLFNVIQFANAPCNSTDNSRTGVCFTTSECSNKGGRSGGVCAAGFGVCCVCENLLTNPTGCTTFIYLFKCFVSVEYSCDDASSQPQDVVYFQNKKFPEDEDEPEICLFTVQIKDNSICQLR